MIRTLKAWFMHISKLDFICVFLLLSATIITRLLLTLNASVIYAQDAYTYLGEARDFASSGTIQFRMAGTPFVLFLGVFLKILGILGEFLAARLFMLITSSLLVVSLYLLGRKMSGSLLGFLAAFAATFEPYFLKYSIVPYTEPFAISMGLSALYFSTSDKKLQSILALIFFYLAIFTRPELYFSLLIPILIFHFHKKVKIGSKRGLTAGLIASIFLTILIYVLPLAGLFQFGLSWGGIGIVERFSLFLKPELLRITIESSFYFYDQQFLNQAIYVIVALGIALALRNIVAKVKFEKTGKIFRILMLPIRIKDNKSALFPDNVMAAFCLFLFLAIYFIVLTVLGFRYDWAFYVAPSDMTDLDILSKALIIIPRLHDRYLILPRLLFSYPFAYTLSVVMQKVYAGIVRQK